MALPVSGLKRSTDRGMPPGKSALRPTSRPASGSHWLFQAPVRSIRTGAVPASSSVVT